MLGIWTLEYYCDRRGRHYVAVVSSTGETVATFRAWDFQKAWDMVIWRNSAAAWAVAPQLAA